MNEAHVLLATAATIAFAHTLLGPDHYLVFTALGKARKWSLARTLRVTLYCGIGHVLGSVAIGTVGILIGAKLLSLTSIETIRGDLAGWALLIFGTFYFAWGLKRAARSRRHTHVHAHGDLVHSHEHDHHHEHAHPHTEAKGRNISPWALFIIFILGPCEALIPLFMYPAAQQSSGLVIGVALVFGVVTLATMLAAVTITSVGLSHLKVPLPARFSHAFAGASVMMCGIAVTFLNF